ncbi:GvpL/GvpF family gas vesicle protein [Rhodococcus sp. NPDC003318]|uniref:GvpL/GvpF family gas vesicle protein n=1 Tax=Rhodococcus sp. NPDC003318 TaxID=3364503 RepID=UPI0036C75F52
MTAEDTGVWVYAVTASPREPATLPVGVAGEPVRTVNSEGLIAFVGTVGLDEFGTAALHRHLEDLDWLEVVARAHDAVVAAVAHGTATIPLRLATVCSDDNRVLTLLEQHRAEFDAALRRVAGRAEWGVRAYADPDRQSAEDDESGAAGGPGARYLARRRHALTAREAFAQAVAGDADEVHTVLMRVAAAARRQPPTSPVLTGTREWMPLNGTYLVDEERTAEFTDAVTDSDRAHDRLRLELSGPWPPYSFTGMAENGQEETP